MNRKYFTEKEINQLKKNKYILRVSKSSITYSIEFKEVFIKGHLEGTLPRIIFEKYGFDIEIIGYKRIEQSAARWKKKYKENGILGLKGDRKTNSGRLLVKEFSKWKEM